MNCRACNSSGLFLAVDLGLMPIAEVMLKNKNDKASMFDTKMFICKDCGLGQLEYDIKKEEVFNDDYFFFSSKSNSVISYAESFCNYAIEEFNIDENDWVLEIGSNDGYLLQHFKNKGIDVLGIDPVKEMANRASFLGINTIVDFFGFESAVKILKEKGSPKLIVANNVLAHVPDIQDFMMGLFVLCNKDTVVTIENPSILNILKLNHFDTIYHEHYSYLSCNSIFKLAEKHSLKLFNIMEVPIQGVSNRYLLSKTKKVQDSIHHKLKQEIDDGLFDENKWEEFYNNLINDISVFKTKLLNIKNNKQTIYGYAASSKAVELLNFAQIDNNIIDYVVDDAEDKQGKFIPGVNIPITSMNKVLELNPDHIIVFSWNIYNDIIAKLKEAGYNGKVWIWSDK